jgi:hypothetical protein
VNGEPRPETNRRFTLAVRVALALGFCIDAFVGLLCLFAQPLIEPLLGLAVRDPAMTTIAGGELIVAACVYALAFRDPLRWRPLLWICALDQTLGIVLPALEIARGNAPASFKTFGPMPFQAVLVALCVAYAARPGRKRSATPFMQ